MWLMWKFKPAPVNFQLLRSSSMQFIRHRIYLIPLARGLYELKSVRCVYRFNYVREFTLSNIYMLTCACVACPLIYRRTRLQLLVFPFFNYFPTRCTCFVPVVKGLNHEAKREREREKMRIELCTRETSYIYEASFRFVEKGSEREGRREQPE